MTQVMVNLMIMCFSLIALNGCNVGINGLKASDHQISRQYTNVKNFTSIESDAVANIIYVQSDTVSVRVAGPDNFVPFIEIKDENGALKINMKKGVSMNMKNLKPSLIVYLASPDLKKIEQNGVGNITLRGVVRVEEMEIESDAVGNVKAENLICKSLSVQVDGVGNMDLCGACDAAEYGIDGVGNLRAKDMKAKVLKVEQNGVGNVSCYASDRLVVHSNGVGNVKYAGNPKEKDLHQDGVGRVKAL